MTEIALVQSLREMDTSKPRQRSTLLWTVLSVMGFLVIPLVFYRDFFVSMITLTVIVLVHELGHYFAMCMFGFRNVKLFLIPFMGGLATGTKHAAPAWQSAIVLFSGPLPGLCLGVMLWISLPREIEVITPDTLPMHTSLIYESALFLVLINTINLLPFLPLDGGRILRLLLDRTSILMNVALAIISILVVIWFSIATSSWIVALFSTLFFCTVPSNIRLSYKTAELRPQLPDLASDLSRITDKDGALLLQAANDIASREIQFFSREPDEMNEHLLETAKELHEKLVAVPLSQVAASVVLFVYFAAWSMPLICIFFPISIQFVTNYRAP